MAFFSFEGNSCPPLLLVTAFCEAASAWLRGGLENVVVVHCKRGLARTGLMISCLLLHLKVCGKIKSIKMSIINSSLHLIIVYIFKEFSLVLLR